MVFQIAIVIIIPLILGIVTVTPFDEPEIDKSIVNDDSKFGIFYFLMILVWTFFLSRILLQLKKGTFSLQRKF